MDELPSTGPLTRSGKKKSSLANKRESIESPQSSKRRALDSDQSLEPEVSEPSSSLPRKKKEKLPQEQSSPSNPLDEEPLGFDLEPPVASSSSSSLGTKVKLSSRSLPPSKKSKTRLEPLPAPPLDTPASVFSALFGMESSEDIEDSDPHSEEDDTPFGRAHHHEDPSHRSADSFRSFLSQLGLFAGGSGGRYKGLLERLSADLDTRQGALEEITEMLLMGNEETLGGFRPDQFVPVLQEILNSDEVPHQALLACRALTNMVEAFPSSTAAVAACAPTLCSKLLCIEYIDLAEQCLIALNKLSVDQSHAVLQAGGLNAVMSYLDFFPISLQRMSLATAVNLCRSARPEAFPLIADAFPVLGNLLEHNDKTLRENATICVLRLCENLGSQDLIAFAQPPFIRNLLAIAASNAGARMVTMSLKILSLLARALFPVIEILHSEKIGEFLKRLIVGDHTEALMSRAGRALSFTITSEQVSEIVALVDELLPSLPGDMFFAPVLALMEAEQVPVAEWQWQFDDGTWRPFARRDCALIESAHARGDSATLLNIDDRTYIVSLRDMVQISQSTRRARPIRRIASPKTESKDVGAGLKTAYFEQHSDLIDSFSVSLLALIFDLYLSTAKPSVQLGLLEVILKLLHFTSASCLRDVLLNLTISSFLVEMLASPAPYVVVAALQMAQILLAKLPDIFHTYYRRRGVMHQISVLVDKAQQPLPSDVKPMVKILKEKEKKKSRRSRSSLGLIGDDDETSVGSAHPAPDFTPIILTEGNNLMSLLQDSAPAKGTYEALKDPHPAMETLRSLHQLGLEVDALSESEKVEEHVAVLSRLAAFICNDSVISSFELHTSSCIDVLLKYLTCKEYQLNMIERHVTFYRIFFDSKGKHLAVHTLVDILQGCLTILESFPASTSTDLDSNRADSALNAPIKLRLERESDETDLKDFSAAAVIIEPLASIQAIEDYLWPKVRKETTAVKVSRLRVSSRSKSESKDDDSTSLDHSPSAGNVDEEDPDDRRSGDKRPDVTELRFPPISGPSSSSSSSDAGDSFAIDAEKDPRVLLRSSFSSAKRLTILLNDVILPSNLTIYQAIQAFGSGQSSAPELPFRDLPLGIPPEIVARLMGNSFTLKYREYRPSDDSERVSHSRTRNSSSSVPLADLSSSSKLPSSIPASMSLSSLANLELQFAIDPEKAIPQSDALYPVLHLLKILFVFNSNHPLFNNQGGVVPLSAFHNSKLSAKLIQQVSDLNNICKASFPAWTTQLLSTCSFILPLPSRLQYFRYIAFGSFRSLHQYLLDHRVVEEETTPSSSSDASRKKLTHVKVRVERQRLLDAAHQIMQAHASTRTILDVEFFDEIGTGLGPTLEFYAKVSQLFSLSSLRMWRKDTAQSDAEQPDYAFGSRGLFVRPIAPGHCTPALFRLFHTLGRFIGKAIVDERLIDLPLSLPFYKWMLGGEEQLCLADLQYVDADLWKSLLSLEGVVKARHVIISDPSLSSEEKASRESALTMDGVPVSEFLAALDFTLPGYPDIALKENGSDLLVTLDNLQEYIDLVVRFTLVEGVVAQMDAFCDGINAVFPLSSLSIFAPEEVDLLLRGNQFVPWTVHELREACKADHGYTLESPAVTNLFEILSEFNQQDQRLFVAFVTGSVNLPVGGLRSLRPHLRIVRKESSGPDTDLPSVMTCQNYLKLPEYSTKEIMAKKLRLAISEGQGSFLLS